MVNKNIKKFNQYEEEIYHLCLEEKINYKQVDCLLKNGASANAIGGIKYEDGTEGEELLLAQCWFDRSSKFSEMGKQEVEDNCYIQLLQIFIENGLDIDQYVNHLFENIPWTCDEKHYIEMTKLILSKLKDKENLDLEKALSSISSEIKYHNVCEANHEYANELSTIYEMIKNFKHGKDANQYFNYKKILGQKVKNVVLYCENLKVDFKEKMIAENVDIFLECEKDILKIQNKFVFVDNNEVESDFEKMDEESIFLNQLKNLIVNEEIKNITFLNENGWLKQNTLYNMTKIEIEFTHHKKIVIDLDESFSNVRITIS